MLGRQIWQGAQAISVFCVGLHVPRGFFVHSDDYLSRVLGTCLLRLLAENVLLVLCSVSVCLLGRVSKERSKTASHISDNGR